MDAKKFGSFIAERRKSLGMTQAALAEKLHVTDKAVSRWERGQGFPDIHSIEPLAVAPEVSVAEIMRGEKSTAALADEDASLAAKNVIRVAEMKRAEQRQLAAAIAGAALPVFCVFLFDVMGPMGFFGAALPCLGLAAGVVLALLAAMRRRRRLPVRATALGALLFLAVPALFLLLLLAAGAFGLGPVPG